MDLRAPGNWQNKRRDGADHWWLDHVIAWATRQTPAQVWIWCAVSATCLGLFDRVTGQGVWIGPLYLLLICLPAWSLGWREGIAFGLICMVIGLWANNAQVYATGDAGVVWNMLMRVVSISTIVVLVSGFRRSYDREWHRARTDALTGGLNRQALYEYAAKGRGDARWGVLAYIDLDGFKSINDDHGHAAGDATLRAFAAEVRANIRASDSFARIGGDEFLVHMHVESEADGYHLARHLHARMNGLPLDHPIRCSMGVLVLHPDACAIDDANVNVADRLMYQAKQDGGGIRITTIMPEKVTDTDVMPRPEAELVKDVTPRVASPRIGLLPLKGA